MYQVNRKLLNSDGTANLDRAIEEGHRARTRALRVGLEVLRGMATRLIKRCRGRLSGHGDRRDVIPAKQSAGIPAT